LKLTLCSGARVKGRLRPLRVKAVPVKFACEMVRFDPPVLVKVSGWVLLLPTATLAKETTDGLAARVPGVVPVPDNEIVRGEDVVAIEREALALPAAEGANLTLKLVLCPGARVRGRLRPVVEKEPVTAA
jgi:hypothetical protein